MIKKNVDIWKNEGSRKWMMNKDYKTYQDNLETDYKMQILF